MNSLLSTPLLWVGLGVILIVVIVISVMVSKKRAKEVAELDKMFPEGHLTEGNVEKISVERVRRTTLEREKRKKQQQHISSPKVQPKLGEKVPGEEEKSTGFHSKKIKEEEIEEKNRNSTSRSRSKLPSSSSPEDNQVSMMDEIDDTKKNDRKMKNKSSKKDVNEMSQAQESDLDPTTSRRSYKKSLLSPERSSDGLDGAEQTDETVSNSEVMGEQQREDNNNTFSAARSKNNFFSRMQRKAKTMHDLKSEDEEDQLEKLKSRSKRSSKKRFF